MKVKPQFPFGKRWGLGTVLGTTDYACNAAAALRPFARPELRLVCPKCGHKYN